MKQAPQKAKQKSKELLPNQSSFKNKPIIDRKK